MGKKRGRKKKPYAAAEIKCPDCKCHIKVRIHKDVVTPSVKGEYKFRAEVEKDPQGRLFDDDAAKAEGKGKTATAKKSGGKKKGGKAK